MPDGRGRSGQRPGQKRRHAGRAPRQIGVGPPTLGTRHQHAGPLSHAHADHAGAAVGLRPDPQRQQRARQPAPHRADHRQRSAAAQHHHAQRRRRLAQPPLANGRGQPRRRGQQQPHQHAHADRRLGPGQPLAGHGRGAGDPAGGQQPEPQPDQRLPGNRRPALGDHRRQPRRPERQRQRLHQRQPCHTHHRRGQRQ